MIRKALPPRLSESNVGAMLKRCTVMVNTKKNLYVRLAGMESEVVRHPLLPSYLEPRAGAILTKFLKKNALRDQEDYDAALAFEKRMIAKAFPGTPVAAPALQPRPPAAGSTAADGGPDDDPFGHGGGLDGADQSPQQPAGEGDISFDDIAVALSASSGGAARRRGAITKQELNVFIGDGKQQAPGKDRDGPRPSGQSETQAAKRAKLEPDARADGLHGDQSRADALRAEAAAARQRLHDAEAALLALGSAEEGGVVKREATAVPGASQAHGAVIVIDDSQ